MTSTDLAGVTERPVQTEETKSLRGLVVVIEDDYRSSLALTMLIDDWGFFSLAARSAREAVELSEIGSAMCQRLSRTLRLTAKCSESETLSPWP